MAGVSRTFLLLPACPWACLFLDAGSLRGQRMCKEEAMGSLLLAGQMTKPDEPVASD